MPQRKLAALLVIAIISTLALFVFTKINEDSNILSKLRANYENVSVKKSTLLSYDAQKITISSNNKKILLQVVENVDTKSLLTVIEKLENEILAVNEKRVYFNPYEGESIEYSVPDEFKYIREETSREDLPQRYYIVYGNDIFSYFIFSEDQIKFRGIASVFSCKNDVYKVDIFSEVTSFNKDESLNELSNLYCL